MKIEDVKKLSPHERFVYWVKERETIRSLKESFPDQKPWTDDEILQSYRFCNVRRKDDKVSQWLIDNWYKPNFDHKNMLLAVALARFVNRLESLEFVGFPKRWNKNEVKKRLRRFRDADNTVFNGAYMVRGNDGRDKIECVVDYYVKPLEKLRDKLDTGSMEETWKIIVESYGMGSFMAGQIVADLRHGLKGIWHDRDDWAPMGPGSKRGMNRYHGRPINAPLKQDQFLRELREVIDRHAPIFPEGTEAIDVQNCFCEYDKHSRVLFGEGRPKSKYPGA